MYCVYKHTCPNGKSYIGISKNPVKRWNNGQGYKKHIYFYNAIQKYGWNNIHHEFLFTNLTHEDACYKEIELIAEYKTNNSKYGYNISIGGDSGANGRRFVHNEETKRKISAAHKGRKLSKEHIQKIRDTHVGMTGKHHSNETRKKISESAKGKNKGKKQSDITKKKISTVMKQKYLGGNNPMAKAVINLDTGEIFSAVAEARRKYNISTIYNCCCGNQKTAGGYHWKYVNEEVKTP